MRHTAQQQKGKFCRMETFFMIWGLLLGVVLLVIFIGLYVDSKPINIVKDNISRLKKYITFDSFHYGQTSSAYYNEFSYTLKNCQGYLKELHSKISTSVLEIQERLSNSEEAEAFYKEQIAKLKDIYKIQSPVLIEFSKIKEGEDFPFNETGKLEVQKLHREYADFISSFIITNNKYYREFLERRLKIKNSKLSEEQIIKNARIKKIIFFLFNIISSIGVGILANCISSAIIG